MGGGRGSHAVSYRETQKGPKGSCERLSRVLLNDLAKDKPRQQMKESGDRREVRVTDFIKAKMCVQQKRLSREINRRLAELKNMFGRHNERERDKYACGHCPFLSFIRCPFYLQTRICSFTHRDSELKLSQHGAKSTF